MRLPLQPFMKIIIDLRPLIFNCVSEEAKHFIFSSLYIITKENKEHEWFFLVDQFYITQKDIYVDEKKLIIKKSFKNIFGWKIWYGFQLPNLVKKYKIDLLITTGGVASSSYINQCVWMPKIIEKNNGLNKNYFSFYKKRLTSTLQKAQTIFVFSEKNKQEFINKYKLEENKLFIIRSAPNAGSAPLAWTEKENIKIKYAGGKEFFAVAGSFENENFINILKAFSQFKKRQQSNMQLVIAVKNINKNNLFIQKLESYKYKADVHLINRFTNDEMIKIIAASYVLINQTNESEPATIVLNACKSEIAIIANDNEACRETLAGAALYADINNPESLSAQLMLLYKDENLRNKLIEKGKSKVEQFDFQKTKSLILNGILNAANNNKPNKYSS
jgi:glycosyltransferase involved in cell wall biosynthesis